MKFVKLVSISWLVLSLLALTIEKPDAEEEIVLQARIVGCNTLHLFEYQGFGFSIVQTAKDSAHQFSFRLPRSGPRFYYIGPNARAAVPIILGPEDSVLVRGNCGALRDMEIPDSPVNQNYRQVMQSLKDFNQNNAGLRDSLKVHARNKEKSTEFFRQLQAADQSWIAFLNKVKQEDPFLGGILSLNTFLNFPNRGQEAENSPEQYYNRFFQFADFEQEVYANIPWTAESFKNYVNTLARMGLPDEQLKELAENALHKIPKGTGAQKMAYAGVLSAMKENVLPGGYAHFGQQFGQLFSEADPVNAATVKREAELASQLATGAVAPDFTQQSPEESPFSLSSLRGKVVLIDFWASWCRPCRMENPNVVRVYQKYKDKGFEILGVSLDQQRDRWLQAIQADQLTWRHVSDLKGWQNEVAKLYWVHSIPQTVLLDAEGKILARNLRGHSLEQKLAELFEQ